MAATKNKPKKHTNIADKKAGTFSQIFHSLASPALEQTKTTKRSLISTRLPPPPPPHTHSLSLSLSLSLTHTHTRAHTYTHKEKLREKERRQRGRQSACLLINTVRNLNQFQTQQVTAVNKGDNEHASPLVMAAMSSPWRQDMPTRNGT